MAYTNEQTITRFARILDKCDNWGMNETARLWTMDRNMHPEELIAQANTLNEGKVYKCL